MSKVESQTASDSRLEPLARLLCKQWDDDWKIGKKLHIQNAKDILVMTDEFDQLKWRPTCRKKKQ